MQNQTTALLMEIVPTCFELRVRLQVLSYGLKAVSKTLGIHVQTLLWLLAQYLCGCGMYSQAHIISHK